MELTWIAILASLSMALAAVCIFIFAVKKDLSRDFTIASLRLDGYAAIFPGIGLPKGRKLRFPAPTTPAPSTAWIS
jgi:hypothetical protein